MRHNFVDTPSDQCICDHGIEDTNHFLFSCPFYTIPRVTLMASVTEILLKYNLNHLGNQAELYLYGQSNISDADNRNITLIDNNLPIMLV